LVAAHISDDCAPWPKSAAILHSSSTVGTTIERLKQRWIW